MAQQPHRQQVQQQARRGQLALRCCFPVPAPGQAVGPQRCWCHQPPAAAKAAAALQAASRAPDRLHAAYTARKGCCCLRPATMPSAAATATLIAAAMRPMVVVAAMVVAAGAAAMPLLPMAVPLPAAAMAVAAVVPAIPTARRPPGRGMVPAAVDPAVPPIVCEGMMGQALPRAERVVLLAQASEDEHRTKGVQGGVRQLLRRQRALAPVADLWVRDEAGWWGVLVKGTGGSLPSALRNTVWARPGEAGASQLSTPYTNAQATA